MARYVLQPSAADLNAVRAANEPSAVERLLGDLVDDPSARLLAEEIEALEGRIGQAEFDLQWLRRRRADKLAELRERKALRRKAD